MHSGEEPHGDGAYQGQELQDITAPLAWRITVGALGLSRIGESSLIVPKGKNIRHC